MSIKGKDYIGCLNILLYMWILNSLFTIVHNAFACFSTTDPPIVHIIILCVNFVLLFSIYLLQEINKIGFYIFVFAEITQLISAILFPHYVEKNAVLRSIIGSCLLLILLSIKNKKTKMNGFQILGIVSSKIKSEKKSSDYIREQTNEGDETK